MQTHSSFQRLGFVSPIPLSDVRARWSVQPKPVSLRIKPLLSTASKRMVRMVLNIPAEASPATAPASIPDSSNFNFADESFIEQVSGEWFGYEVAFSPRTGDAMEIEERFVPEAYREWDVKITGFDCLTSSTVLKDSLYIRRTRALPSVGCEADAVVPDTLETTVSPYSAGSFCGGFADGSYSIGPASFTNELSQKWSVALASEGESGHARARIDFGRVDRAAGKVSVWIESHYSDYNGGEILPGCGSPHSNFGGQERMRPDRLAGVWDVHRTQFTSVGGWKEQQVREMVERGSDATMFALPSGISLFVGEHAGITVVEAGWLTGDDSRVVVKREYNNTGELTSVSRALETRVA